MFRPVTMWPAVVLPLLGLAAAADVTYITDLPIASSLGPCVEDAVSIFFSFQSTSPTGAPCPTEPAQFQSCVCSERYESIYWSISDGIQDYCGGTTSGNRDQSSVQTVMQAYCNQDTTYSFETPKYPVTVYIDELDAFKSLPSCAASQLLTMVNPYMTNNFCPSYASGLAPCACNKQGFSTQISSFVGELIKTYCHNTKDIKSARDVFAEYCLLNSGITLATTEATSVGNTTPTSTATPTNNASPSYDTTPATRTTPASGSTPTSKTGGELTNRTSTAGSTPAEVTTNGSVGPNVNVIMGVVVGCVGLLAGLMII